MSHSGIGLQFTLGPGAKPHQLVIRDTEAWCPACGFELQIRHYSDLPFHSLTTARLAAAVLEPPEFDEVCGQCDHDICEEDARAWSMHVGFSSGHGILSGFAEVDGATGWALRPRRTLNVQQLPAFRPADLDASGDQPLVATLDEDAIFSVFGRYWNPKSAVRRWVLSHPSPADGQVRRVELAPGTVVFDAPAGTPEADIQAKALDPIRGTAWIVAPLWTEESAPAGFFGAPADWLHGLAKQLEGRDLWCAADPSMVFQTVDSVCSEFPIATRVRMDADGTLWLRMSGRKDREGAPEIDPNAVALEAAQTGSAVEDIARLELDRIVIGLVLTDTPDTADTPPLPQNILQHPSMDTGDLGIGAPLTDRTDVHE
jgi:hypothetical protein